MAVIINNVWIGEGALGALEKFNIYSWRALGHHVNLFTYRSHTVAHTPKSLGLEEGDATVIGLAARLQLDEYFDDGEEERNPKNLVRLTRAISRRWLQAIPRGEPPTRDHIYNMVDLTKSYVGATERGIVLDLKVGPSPHLAAYEACFAEKFISYTRGSNTAERPENQCIGTMQDDNELRCRYAENFALQVQTNRGDLEAVGGHERSWFNAITGWHGRAFAATRAGMDVARTPPPTRGSIDSFAVSEIGAPGHGPFRVFKRADDQTNKSGGGTKKSEVKVLAEEVWKKELSNSGGDKDLLAKAKAAMQALPTDKLW